MSKRNCPDSDAVNKSSAKKKRRKQPKVHVTESDTSKFNEPKSRPHASKVREHDEYCWTCHKECSESPVRCSNCEISLHSYCEPDIKRTRPNWTCRECRSVEPIETTKHLNFKRMDEAFESLVELVSTPVGKFDIPYSDYSLKLLNRITLEEIANKARNCQYNSAHELLMDFKWLRHNCEILHKYCEKDEKIYLKHVLESGRKLFIECEKELQAFLLCGDCYMYREKPHSITMLCTQPHLVLWVQFDSWPYWPAKCIADVNGKLEVKFFRDHSTATVKYSKCYLYTKENPNVNDIKQNDQIDEAIQEAEEYISKIEAKFGPFRYAEEFIKPEKGKLDTVHLNDQIPGFRDPSVQHRIVDSSPLHDSPTIVQQNGPSNHDAIDKEELDLTSNDEQLPSSVTEGLRKCHQYIKLLHKEWQSGKEEIQHQGEEINHQRMKIERQRNKIETLTNELKNAQVKKCKKCSGVIEVENPEMCLACTLTED